LPDEKIGFVSLQAISNGDAGGNARSLAKEAAREREQRMSGSNQ
jgi:hypothetical protein